MCLGLIRNLVTEYYSRMVDSFVDNVISTTNLVNKSLVVFNMENIQRLADTTKESNGGLGLRMQRQLAGH